MTTCAHICTNYTHMFTDHFYLGIKGLSLNRKLMASAKLPGLELQVVPVSVLNLCSTGLTLDT